MGGTWLEDSLPCLFFLFSFFFFSQEQGLETAPKEAAQRRKVLGAA